MTFDFDRTMVEIEKHPRMGGMRITSYDMMNWKGINLDYTTRRNQMTKCDFVMEQLKEQIFTGEYKAGDQLPPEGTLCTMFSVSRITVREALKKLNMMGLVEIKQGKGTFVKSADLGIYMKPLLQLVDFDEIDVETIYTAREYIEGSIAYLAARNRTENELTVLRSILQNIYRSFNAQDVTALNEFDRSFHAQLAKAAHNPILFATYQALDEIDVACVKRFNKYLNTYLDTCYAEHLAVFSAVEKQQPEEARQAMISHARTSKAVLID